MHNDNLILLPTSETTETFSDALSDLIRRGARQIISQAVEAELQEFLEQYQDRRDEQGRQVVVRNGYLPEHSSGHYSITAMFISGPMAFISIFVPMNGSAFWSSLALRVKATKRSSG